MHLKERIVLMSYDFAQLYGYYEKTVENVPLRTINFYISFRFLNILVWIIWGF